VKATFDRISRPPEGVSIPRSILFKAVSEISAPDKYTIHFKRGAPRPASFIMAAIASGWNGIVRKKTLEENNYNLRKVPNIPGTGPYKTVRRVENEVWVVEKNKDYWNKGLPYLDGIEFYNLIPFSPELGAAVLSNRVDYARIVDPVTARKAKVAAGHVHHGIQPKRDPGDWVNSRKKPFDDPRGRRAFNLALDRHVLVDVTKDVAPMRVGGFIYPFSEFATPTDQLFKRVGYQEDPTAALKEAKALMAAAGYANGVKGLDFMVRDVATFKLWAQAIQAMLQQGIDVQCNLRTVVESVWFDDAASGHFDVCVGAIVSTLLDPSDYFNAWYRSGGRRTTRSGAMRSLTGWSIRSIRVDPATHGADPSGREIAEQDPPVLPICWEQINDVWWNGEGLQPA
jgi:ABC-type transport system substrate-binding protein